MSQQQPGSARQHGGPQPDKGQWYRDEWPDAAPQAPHPWRPAALPGQDEANGRGTRVRPLTVGLIGVLAAVVAAVAVLILVYRPSSSAPSAAAGGNPPAAGQPVQGGGGGGHLFLGGTVSKISSTSITISGQAHVITAAITSSTEFTGTAKNAGAIKQGDSVTVVVSGYGSAHPVANSISDPAGTP
jgi:hypothetical protein